MAQNQVFVGILGSGAREYALAWKLRLDAQSQGKELILGFFPGNAALSQWGGCFEDFDSLVEAGDRCAWPRYLICGSEVYAGYGEALEGWKVWGPSAAAAKLETSKVFSKKWMRSYRIPTAKLLGVVEGRKSLEAFFASHPAGTPLVMKYDGLLGGKGVLVVETLKQAGEFYEGVAKAAGDHFSQTFVMETFLRGVERSLFLFLDKAGHIQAAPLSMDFKAKYDGNQGPNTGGMGAFTPAPLPLAEKDWNQWLRQTLIPRLGQALTASKLHYAGVLYVGLMITNEGPQVLEFNVRLGDPEAQTLMPLLKTPLLTVLDQSISGTLQAPLEFEAGRGVAGIVCATQDYGEPPSTRSAASTRLPSAWWDNPPYRCFWGGLRAGGQGTGGGEGEAGKGGTQADFWVGSGRIVTVTYDFGLAQSDESLLNLELAAQNWIEKSKWPHIHFRRDLMSQYLKQRKERREQL
jgi:phosphoribosylamine--glycine ligase